MKSLPTMRETSASHLLKQTQQPSTKSLATMRETSSRQWRLVILLPCALLFTLWRINDIVALEHHTSLDSSLNTGRMLHEVQEPPQNVPIIDIISIG
jgi:hypothetical protein